LSLIVVGFTVGEDFADVVDHPLYLVDVSEFLLLHYQGRANDLGGHRYVEEEGLIWLWRCQDRWLGGEHLELIECLLHLLHPTERVRLF
jgi:hypothetical protein